MFGKTKNPSNHQQKSKKDRGMSSPKPSGAKGEEKVLEPPKTYCSECNHEVDPDRYGGCEYCQDHRIPYNNGCGGLVDMNAPRYTWEQHANR